MPAYTTMQCGNRAYNNSVVYCFKILVDGVAVKDSTPENPPLEDPPEQGWVGVYPDKVFEVQVAEGGNAQQAILDFVTRYKSKVETPPTPVSITEISI